MIPEYLTLKEAAEYIQHKYGNLVKPRWLLELAANGKLKVFLLVRMAGGAEKTMNHIKDESVVRRLHDVGAALIYRADLSRALGGASNDVWPIEDCNLYSRTEDIERLIEASKQPTIIPGAPAKKVEDEQPSPAAKNVRGITKKRVIAAFEGVHFDSDAKWSKALADVPQWLKTCRVVPGSKSACTAAASTNTLHLLINVLKPPAPQTAPNDRCHCRAASKTGAALPHFSGAPPHRSRRA